jgi:hypothetical protein
MEQPDRGDSSNRKDEAVQISVSQKNKCDECRKHVALYQCPRCRFRSCSLACCKAHKDRTKCNGKRDRTAYVRGMTDEMLQSDYHFLEEVLGTVDSSKRLLRHVGATAGAQTTGRRFKSPKTATRDGQDSEAPLPLPPPHALLQLEKEANGQAASVDARLVVVGPSSGKFQNLAASRGVRVMHMPTGMERHQRNRSHVKHGTIYWTVEWIMHTFDAHAGNHHPNCKLPATAFTTPTLSEKDSILDALSKLMQNDPEWRRTIGSSSQQESLSWPPPPFRLLLRRRPCPAGQPPFVELSATATLASALADTTVIEFPTIHVVHESRLSEFPCAISDCTNNDVVVGDVASESVLNDASSLEVQS